MLKYPHKVQKAALPYQDSGIHLFFRSVELIKVLFNSLLGFR